MTSNSPPPESIQGSLREMSDRNDEIRWTFSPRTIKRIEIEPESEEPREAKPIIIVNNTPPRTPRQERLSVKRMPQNQSNPEYDYG